MGGGWGRPLSAYQEARRILTSSANRGAFMTCDSQIVDSPRRWHALNNESRCRGHLNLTLLNLNAPYFGNSRVSGHLLEYRIGPHQIRNARLLVQNRQERYRILVGFEYLLRSLVDDEMALSVWYVSSR